MNMNRREFLATAMAGAISASALSGGGVRAQSKPNIILCMADDQGWGDMAYNGHPLLHTPNFDDMAATGLRFDRFYAACPVCTPTRGSVMTGRHPNRFGGFSWGHSLRPQEITVAEALKTAGYRTGHFGKWHLGSVQHGSPVNPGASGFDDWLSAPNFFDNDPILSREGDAVPLEGESSMVTVDAALDFIRESAESDQPFLAVVWFGSPHRPHRALDEDRALYEDEPEDYQHFYGEITAMDRAFGKLRDSLAEIGIRDNTILWYCSDNGGLPKYGRTGGRGTKGDIYEGGLRVPAILEWLDRISSSRIIDMPCVTSDIYPTLLSITGVTVPNQPPLDGVDLSQTILEGAQERPNPIGFWEYPIRGISTPSAEIMAELLEAQKEGRDTVRPELLRKDAAEIDKTYPKDEFPGHAAWLDWPWKLHRIEENGNPANVSVELYNLADDPMESEDRAGQDDERTTVMLTELEHWLNGVVASLNGADYSG